MELPTISLGEDLMKPTAMLYRNLMAMEVEETIRAHPLDGVVLLGNCDKTIPAQLMGAASANLPALQLSGGYRRTGRFHGAEVGAAPICGSTGRSGGTAGSATGTGRAWKPRWAVRRARATSWGRR
ncbi:dihydroxy-acid dehydratase domain-containing protein [Actinomadura madurae]|uniref:dihydroxy-acid dehydratase domain-containing protein n=1 Tax=Actinomadura madurae TaxID=1993 RepID=UPI0020D21612|nr:dihydroxy-acid dehydratase [Actinomadura madurae]